MGGRVIKKICSNRPERDFVKLACLILGVNYHLMEGAIKKQ